MANSDTPYIAKAAGPLTNPTTATLFLQLPSPIATVASTQVLKVAYATYRGYNQSGTGVSNNIDLVRFLVRSAGRVTYGAAGNFTPTLVIGGVATTANFIAGSATTNVGSNTVQAASGAGTGIWEMTANLTWDPNTGLIAGSLSGSQTVLVAGTATTTLTTLGAITPIQGYTAAQVQSTQSNTVVTTIPAANGELALFFAVNGIFSASNAANVATQDYLETEAA